MVMEYIGSLVVALFVINSANTESMTVTDTEYPVCKTYYLSEAEELDIHYYGEMLNGECTIKVESFGIKDLCITAESFEISSSCQVKVKYFEYSWQSSPDKEYDCNDNSPPKWCPGKSEIKIGISRYGWGSKIGNTVHLKVTQTDSDIDDIADIAGSVVKITYIIIGCVIGAIVLISVIVTIIICCVCNKRRNTRGTVYQNAQQAPNQVPIGAYPTATPYPQAGVYPQAGYQPAAQTGYQPGYQPPQQAAGYQTGPNMEYKPASAPPAEPVQPPPYSAN